MFSGKTLPSLPPVPLFWGCRASACSVYSCGELMRENCLQNWSEWHHVLLPVRRLQPCLRRRLCGLIRGAAASVDPCVPNRSRTINDSPISCGGLGSDVVRRTSVQGRVRTSRPGTAWFWYAAMCRPASLVSARACEYGWEDDMSSYVFMWRVLVRVGALLGFCILMRPLFLPYDSRFTADESVEILGMSFQFHLHF